MKILLVEDNAGDARLLRASLAEGQVAGVDLVHVTRLAQAIACVGRERFDVVLLDLSLPDGHGRDTFARMNAHAAGTPIVVLTGLDDEGLAFGLVQAGAQDYVVKAELDGRTLLRSLRYAIERKKTETELRLAAKVFECTLEGIVIADAEARILSVNHAFTALTGFTQDEMQGTSLWDIGAGPHDVGFFDEVRMHLAQGGQWRGEFLNRCKRGASFPSWLSISVVETPQGSVSHHVAVFTEVSALKLSEQRLQHLAHHDPLTGLPNRVLFHDRLEQSIHRSQRDGRPFALMFVDMDRFKLINDSLGHAVGDGLLQAVASRLKACLREVDTVARLGGDEFAVIVSDLQQREDATVVAEKIVATLGMPYQLDRHEVFVTPSIGVTLYPDGHMDQARLLESADVAMYRAKENGRNNFQYYSADMSAAAYERLRIETSLRRALERNEFLLHYQPQVDLQTGAIVGVEALMRWDHPERGRVLPSEFIPILEETGLIIPVGEWVLETACVHFKAWLDAGIAPRRLAVNLSMRQFRQKNLVETIEAILQRTGLPGHHLELEVTESTVMTNVPQTVATLERLKVMGIQIAIDDFGTGSSSLSHLKSLPIDTVKIGHPFVLDIPHSRDDAAITAAIIGLAQSMRLTSVAECVETEDQAAFLRQQRCDQMQGYLFERPMPAQAMAEMLRRRAGEATSPDVSGQDGCLAAQ